MPGHERFAGMLCIPYLTANDECVALKFRHIENVKPKYDAPGGQAARLYDARVCVDGGETVIITEGELDAILAQRVLGVPAVGTPGTQWHPHWSCVVEGFDRRIVVADHDVKDDGSSPGMRHALHVVEQVSGVLVTPPPGMDLGEWVLAEGEDAVRERVL